MVNSGMVNLTNEYWLGLLMVIFAFLLLGVYASRRVCNAEDFSLAGRSSGVLMVMGAVIGTIVGASSTVGTAQMAFNVGISAWWFCLGGGIALILMGCFYVNPLLDSKMTTVSQFLTTAYDKKTGFVSGICSVLGIFFSASSGSLVLIPMLSKTFSLDLAYGALLAVVLIVWYVFLGGAWATGLMGIFKAFMLYLVLGVAFVVIIYILGGVTPLLASFSSDPWFDMVPNGIFVDMAAGLSTVVGVMTTQTYIQALCSAKNKAVAKKGMILSGFVSSMSAIPAIWVGLFMRANHPDIQGINALTLFINLYFPDWFAGVSIGTLIIASVGSAAGLILGMSTIIDSDVLSLFLGDKWLKNQLFLTRMTVLTVCLITVSFTYLNMNSLVLDWTILSMCLRGAGVFIPFIMAIYMPGMFKETYVTLAIVGGSVGALLWWILCPGLFSPLYPGMLVSCLFMLLGYKKRRYYEI